MGRTVLLSSNSVERLLGREGAAKVTVDHGGYVTMVEWLQKQELEHDYVIYQLDPDPSEWSRRCIRQADRVLIVGDASRPTSRYHLACRRMRMGSRGRSVRLGTGSTGASSTDTS